MGLMVDISSGRVCHDDAGLNPIGQGTPLPMLGSAPSCKSFRDVCSCPTHMERSGATTSENAASKSKHPEDMQCFHLMHSEINR